MLTYVSNENNHDYLIKGSTDSIIILGGWKTDLAGHASRYTEHTM